MGAKISMCRSHKEDWVREGGALHGIIQSSASVLRTQLVVMGWLPMMHMLALMRSTHFKRPTFVLWPSFRLGLDYKELTKAKYFGNP